jgi:vacuolar-type H+-ATPase subunit E/Vma4
MEKVWDELKHIEAEAQRLRTETAEKAKEITDLAKQQAEKLGADSRKYGQQEADALYADAVEDANRKRDEQLKENQVAIEKLRVKAQKGMEQASSTLVNVVLGDNKP